jgi:hypothetical protein
MSHREQWLGVRLGIEFEADALLSTSGMQAYSFALKRAEEASGDEMARDCSVVAATIARRSGRRVSLLDDYSVEQVDKPSLGPCPFLPARSKFPPPPSPVGSSCAGGPQRHWDEG